jgi:hypothetical protein
MLKPMSKTLTCVGATILIAFAPLHRASGKAETITLERYGASFRAPSGWFVSDREKITENIKKLDSEKEDVRAILASHRGSIAIGTYLRHDPRGQTGMIPTINVIGRPNPHKTFEAFRDTIAASAGSLGSALRNYSVKSPPAEVSVGGRRAVAFTAEYDISAAGGNTSRVQGTTYAIPCGDIFLQVSMSESLPAKHAEVFDRFIKSFSFKEPK